MTDVELLVRETLARHKGDVPVADPAEVGPVAARARRRQMANAIGAGLVALAIALGTVTGVGALLRADARRPAIEPDPSRSRPPMALATIPSGEIAPSPLSGDRVIYFYVEDLTARTDATRRWDKVDIKVFADGRVVWSRCSSILPPPLSHDHTGTDLGCEVAPSERSGSLSTGWLEQRLTPEGVELLRSELLGLGLLERDFDSVTPNSTDLVDYLYVEVRDGDRRLNARADYQDLDLNPPTPDELAGLEHIQEIFLDLEGWLPASAWAEQVVTPFVPTSYGFLARGGSEAALLRGTYRGEAIRFGPDDLPSPADRLLTRTGCKVLTLEEAQAVVAAFERAGISRSSEMSMADVIAFLVLGGESGAELSFEPEIPGHPSGCQG